MKLQRGLFASALLVWTAMSLPVMAGERRGGIEIGAKGVKATVVELRSRPGDPAAKEVMSAANNTTISAGVAASGKYDADAIRETAAAAGDFAKRLRDEFGLTAETIRVVGSSGLPKASNRPELIDAVAKATGLAPMEFITPAREVELTILGLVPLAERETTVLVDVGSGNTKGGYLATGGPAVSFSVPLGSVTFADRVTKDAAGKPFPDAADSLRPTLLEKPLAAQAAANPGLAGRPIVLLSGGAPYAMTTLMHPEAVHQERVALSARDIAAYLELLRSRPGVPVPDCSAIADPADREAAEKEARSVGDKFTRENLIAGAEILAALSTSLQFEGKTVVFDRTGVTAVLRGLFEPSYAAAPAPAPPPVVAATAPKPYVAPATPPIPVATTTVAAPKPYVAPAAPAPKVETTETKTPTPTPPATRLKPVYPSPQMPNPSDG